MVGSDMNLYGWAEESDSRDAKTTSRLRDVRVSDEVWRQTEKETHVRHSVSSFACGPRQKPASPDAADATGVLGSRSGLFGIKITK